MTLKEYGITLRHALVKDSSTESVKRIVNKINNAKIDGKPLTSAQKSKLLNYIAYDHTDDGKIIIKESDNSHWLKTIGLLKALIEESDK